MIATEASSSRRRPKAGRPRSIVFSATKGISLALAVLLTAGCQMIPYFPVRGAGTNIEREIDAALARYEPQKSAVVDLNAVVKGSWTRVLIVCWGTTQSTLDRSLGFSWKPKPALNDVNFGAMLVFASENRVHNYFSVGQEDFSRDTYFTPCTPIDLTDGIPNKEPIVLDRHRSSIRFTFDRGTYGSPLWYVPIDETRRLANE